jgi:hypothetical protein
MGYPQYGFPPPTTTNGYCIAALACAIGGLFSCGIGFVLGIVFGVIGKNRVAQTGERGHGLAIAGIVIGAIGVVLAVVVVIAAIVADDGDGSSTDFGNGPVTAVNVG